MGDDKPEQAQAGLTNIAALQNRISVLEKRVAKLEPGTFLSTPTVDKQREKTFDYAADTTKQVLALSAGILTVTITFSNQFVPATTSRTLLVAVGTAWICYIVSIFSGIFALAAMTSAWGGQEKPTIWKPNITKAVGSQLVFFAIGTFTITLSGISKLFCACGQSGHVSDLSSTPWRHLRKARGEPGLERGDEALHHDVETAGAISLGAAAK